MRAEELLNMGQLHGVKPNTFMLNAALQSCAAGTASLSY
jgi:hypothetical protein